MNPCPKCWPHGATACEGKDLLHLINYNPNQPEEKEMNDTVTIHINPNRMLTNDEFIKGVRAANPDLTRDQEMMLRGMYLGYAIGGMVECLAEFECRRLVESFTIMQNIARGGT